MTNTSDSRVSDAYHWLLAEISMNRLPSGTPLSESRIGAQLGISRTPVREALQRLESEGLVRRTDNARFTVSLLTVQEVNDACDLLDALDVYIYTKAAFKHDEAHSALITESVNAMMAAAEVKDQRAWSEADDQFHRIVNEIVGNRLVADTVSQTRRRIQRFWTRAATAQDRLVDCSAEHVALARAIVARDVEAIPPTVHEHIEHMRASVLDKLEAASVFLGAS